MCSRIGRRLVFLPVASLVLAVLGGCASGPRVEAVRSPEADFSRYQTFSFHQPLGTDRQEGAGTILSQMLRRATRAELEALGYRYVQADGDLAVNFFVETREVIEGLRRNPGVSIGYGMFHRHYGVWADYGPEIRQYTEGTLHVDVVDTESNQLVWEGVAQSRQRRDDLGLDQQQVEQALHRVFERFPPAGSVVGSQEDR